MFIYKPSSSTKIFYLNNKYAPFNRSFSKSTKNELEECYKILKVSKQSNENDIRQAFVSLAKKYHPDSGTSDASVEKFIAIENAFRTLTKYNTGLNNNEVDKVVFDIKHTAPQHRQYLSYDGYGYGNPYQREKQWQQAKAQTAAINVMEHRIQSAVATDKTLMTKQKQKHDIKTKYGFDRVVEDLIQESMNNGEFENLHGRGKPLKDQNQNPYVDFTTHKLNEVLINNGFTPEWITMSKEIDEDIKAFKDLIVKERTYLGPYPLNQHDAENWLKIYQLNKAVVQSINNKINKFNLIVPLLNKQKFHVQYDEICTDILRNGEHSKIRSIPVCLNVRPDHSTPGDHEDFFSLLMKAVSAVFSFQNGKKN